MSLGRIVGAAAAIALAGGAGLLLSSPTSAATTPTPVTLNLSGMASAACPLPLHGALAVKPRTTVLLKNDTALAALSTESVTIKPAPDSNDPKSSKTIAEIPAAGAPVAFAKAARYQLSWQIRTLAGSLSDTQKGELVVSANARDCVLAVQLPVPSVSVPVVPSAVNSQINAGASSVVSAVNGGLGTVNSALPPVPTAPALPSAPGLPSVPGLPGGSSPASAPRPGANVPGTTYKPTGLTIADRTVPKGYGSGSGQGGVYVPVTGKSITAPPQQPGSGQGKHAGKAGRSAATAVKSGGSPRSVDLAANRPRSALGALPTLAVILAVLALSGATAYYARTFLLQPAAAGATTKPKH